MTLTTSSDLVSTAYHSLMRGQHLYKSTGSHRFSKRTAGRSRFIGRPILRYASPLSLHIREPTSHYDLTASRYRDDNVSHPVMSLLRSCASLVASADRRLNAFKQNPSSLKSQLMHRISQYRLMRVLRHLSC
ncbi:hypothetical protein PsYK624_150790 [Phanerochaete sordida]|uniref:Uncharacterized protein n=1 Tax=Phanerochaete sordida TaxID=48140 RepID=A0A9P3GNU8_9APHY|nr:hypothetical protein PsYK624_150790 [Phanerochaete sordida]